jgi:hypothetical protein
VLHMNTLCKYGEHVEDHTESQLEFLQVLLVRTRKLLVFVLDYNLDVLLTAL